ncbi:MAG: GatB/YqeY domain-containing protein [Zoogloeaceae bacterium]|nr:GatB/YqeY domain-containing protein [Zoogloeaceae bacterium]
MSLKTRVADDMKTALKAGDKPRLSALRLLFAAIRQKEVDERIELSDEQVLAVIDKMVKQRKDSATQYHAANRPELAAVEEGEIAVFADYLPQPLSADEIAAAIEAAIARSGAASAKDMGKVMGILKAQLAGRADLGEVGGLVKTRLATLAA